MGWLLYLFLYFITFLVILIVAFATVGDVLVTSLLRKYAGDSVGKNVCVAWSVLEGTFELTDLVVSPDALPAVEPWIGLPATWNKFMLPKLVVRIPFWQRFINGQKPLRSTISLNGVNVALELDDASAWVAKREENQERFKQAVEDAKGLRKSFVDNCTQTIVQKLQELHDARENDKSSNEDTQPVGQQQSASNAEDGLGGPPKQGPAWQALIDEIIDSIVLDLEESVLTIKDKYTSTMFGMESKRFTIHGSETSDGRRMRRIELIDFDMKLNARSEEEDESNTSMISSFSVHIDLFCPYVMQSLVMQSIEEKRIIELKMRLAGSEKLNVEMRPEQLQMLMALYRPIQFYFDWLDRAKNVDEISCAELSAEETEEYKRLYKEQHESDQKGMLSRLVSSAEQKSTTQKRQERLSQLEDSVLGTQLLLLRAEVMEWDIPSAGKRAKYVSDELKKKADMRKFMENPIEYYEPKTPKAPFMFHQFAVSLELQDFETTLLTKKQELLSVFAKGFEFSFSYTMTYEENEDECMHMTLTTDRFGLLDKRNSPSNVFRQIMDRNPGAEHIVYLDFVQRSNGKMDVSLDLQDFTLILVFDPLMAASHAFLPALEEDEESQLRYMDFEADEKPSSPEDKDKEAVVYAEEEAVEYIPLILGGTKLDCRMKVKAFEICLVGDPKTLQSHVLAFTSDVNLQLKSSASMEAMKLELVDVALQPCSIVLRDYGIELDIADVGTILELEGEGVDMEIDYRLALVNQKKQRSIGNKQKNAALGQSGSQLWGQARSAMQSKKVGKSQVVTKRIENAEHPELKRDSGNHKTDQAMDRNRVKPSARRKFYVSISDLGLNLSTNDVSVFYGIMSTLNESMKEDKDVVKKREEREKRIADARRRIEEERHLEKLKSEFKKRDADAGGTLDVSEIEDLLANETDRKSLTKDEFNATVQDFIDIVDADHSGDVSLDEFEAALSRNTINYRGEHTGIVILTGQEYADPDMLRSRVPTLDDNGDFNMANASELASFWESYTEQTGASRTSLEGHTAAVIQKKMVRVFKNYEYAQEAWRRLVNPSLKKPGERSDWLLTREMSMGGRSNVIDQLLSSLTASEQAASSIPTSTAHMFVHTLVSSSFGGIYFRLEDEMLPSGIPAIEVSLEELIVYGNISKWEGGDSAKPTDDVNPDVSTEDNYGLGKVTFDLYGKYYNTSTRETEPFLEVYEGVLDLRKDPGTHIDIVYSSDRYLQLNITSAFMRVLNTNMAKFSKVEALSARDRPHIKEEDGYFWLVNDSGVDLSYHVVAKKEMRQEQDTEKVVSDCTRVSHGDADPCHLHEGEDMQELEQQSMKEKEMRRQFKAADADGNRELDTDEVRTVLQNVLKEERESEEARNTYSSHSRRSRSTSELDMDEETLERHVQDFIALADTDASGTVSWEEFKAALQKSRQTISRFVTIHVDGFEPVKSIPLGHLGHDQVFELVPHVDGLEDEDLESLYQRGVGMMHQSDEPSRRELEIAYACLHRVRSKDPNYDWVQSYYKQVLRQYLPVLLSVRVTVDGEHGLQVLVSSAQHIKNGTAKKTQVQFRTSEGEVAHQNPDQKDGEKFYELKGHKSIPIPIDLVDTGFFTIRQIGETEWSNLLQLSVHVQRLYKNFTRFEQQEAQKSQGKESPSKKKQVSAAKMARDQLGGDVALPDLSREPVSGQMRTYPSASVIDDQPTVVTERVAANDKKLGSWSLVVQPQLVLNNVLPCGFEYAVVQATDCPANTLDKNGNFYVSTTTSSKSSARACKITCDTDYFDYVDEVNSRRSFIESGRSVQVFGLKLDTQALVKFRLATKEEDAKEAPWSPPFLVHLDHSRTDFESEQYEVRFDDGPRIAVDQKWPQESSRTLFFYTPYWILNRSGLDYRFRISEGHVVSLEKHREWFPDDRDMPLLATGPAQKALLSVQPYQETNNKYAPDALRKLTSHLPNFHKADWSEAKDMSTVGTSGEIRPSGSGNYSFVLAYEIKAAPGQFVRSKLMILSPRFIFLNKVPRMLEMAPVLLDKKKRRSHQKSEKESCIRLGKEEGAVMYTFAGPEKHYAAIKLRDTPNEQTDDTYGTWSHGIPLPITEGYSVWTRGQFGNGPIVGLSTQVNEETISVIAKDMTETPLYRIENRSTKHSFRYLQNGVQGAEEVTINPLESHSFVWADPLVENPQLKIIPLRWKLPTIVDFMKIGVVKRMTPDTLHAEVYINNGTRVFAVGDTDVYADVRERVLVHDWLSRVMLDFSFYGVGITVVDDTPREMLNMTLEKLQISSPGEERKLSLTLHHMQIDDMSADSPYPVILAPLDSGYNSDRREGWVPDDGERPFFKLELSTSPQAGITVVNDFNLELNSLAVRISLEYIFGLSNVIMEFIPESDEETVVQQGVDTKNQMLTVQVNVPDETQSAGVLLYFKRWRMAPYELHLVFDSSQEEHGEGISSILGNTIGSLVGGIAHVTPEFDFSEISYHNRFFYEYDLIYEVALKLVYSVLGQWYKIVGSVEMLGDPIGLATDIVDGFSLAARQVRRDITGKSLRKGQGAVTVVQTVVGAPMNAVGKLSNGFGDVVKKATSFESQEEATQPKHVGQGLLQSSIVFSRSIGYGVGGIVREPMRGAKTQGFKGFARGVGRGTVQLMASPVVGTLGVVEKMSMSVNNTTHLMDEKRYDGTRRPARDLHGNNPLKQLSDSNIITEVEVFVHRVDGLPEKMSSQVIIQVYMEKEDNPREDVGRFKSSTVRHTANPTFDQSWLIPITSLQTHFEIGVYQKRKPLPKKRFGVVRYSMEDIYRQFESVAPKVLSDPSTKILLKKRSRFQGSVLASLADGSSSGGPDMQDDTWRRRIPRAELTDVMSEDYDDEDDGDDEYQRQLEASSSRSQSVGSTSSLGLSSSTMAVRLGDTDREVTIHLMIRYVNDMRRYG